MTTQLPERLNLALLVVASAAGAALLWGTAHSENGWIIAVCAIGFSFTNNCLFALLHECVHRTFSHRPLLNEWAGRIAACWFPTSLAVQRAFHLTHHRNNRSDREQFDILHPGDIVWLKYAQWYAILTGLYWLIAVVGTCLAVITPRTLLARALRASGARAAEQTSASSYFAALKEAPATTALFETIFTIAVQIALCQWLELKWWSWLLCYAAFAFNWSALQYADHAYSPLDRVHGAWNLNVNPFVRLVFLNYHYHLAHHRHPSASWTALPALARHEPGPSFWRVWLRMWRGPVRTEHLPEIDLQ